MKIVVVGGSDVIGNRQVRIGRLVAPGASVAGRSAGSGRAPSVCIRRRRPERPSLGNRFGGVSMHRRLAMASMFALFACAYITLDRVPRSAVSVLRGGSEFVTRMQECAQTEGPEFWAAPAQQPNAVRSQGSDPSAHRRSHVVGGSGLIGTRLVTRLRQQGHDVAAASSRSGVNTITCEGLAEALTGARVVVDVTNSPSFESRVLGRNIGDLATNRASHERVPFENASLLATERSSRHR
jgi:hypothetical protein